MPMASASSPPGIDRCGVACYVAGDIAIDRKRVHMGRAFNGLAGILFGMSVGLLPRAGAAQPMQVYAAGSLTAAFTEMIKAFAAPRGSVAAPVFGPSGVLRQRIEQGAPADIMASADMTQARTLAYEETGR